MAREKGATSDLLVGGSRAPRGQGSRSGCDVRAASFRLSQL